MSDGGTAGGPGAGGRQQGPAPGWYPDPSGVHAARWWDGTAWTEQVHEPGSAQGHTPPSASSPTVGNRIVLAAVIAAVLVVGGAALALLGSSGPGPSAGTCVDVDLLVDPPADTYLTNRDAGWLREVRCSEPHIAEVIHTISLAEARQEGIASVGEAQRFCAQEYFESFVGTPYEMSALTIEAVWLGPDEEAFGTAEPAVCLLLDETLESSRTGSLRGSRR